jgi:hypothetical protein
MENTIQLLHLDLNPGRPALHFPRFRSHPHQPACIRSSIRFGLGLEQAHLLHPYIHVPSELALGALEARVLRQDFPFLGVVCGAGVEVLAKHNVSDGFLGCVLVQSQWCLILHWLVLCRLALAFCHLPAPSKPP